MAEIQNDKPLLLFYNLFANCKWDSKLFFSLFATPIKGKVSKTFKSGQSSLWRKKGVEIIYKRLNRKWAPAKIKSLEFLVPHKTQKGRIFFDETSKTDLFSNFPMGFSQETFPPNDMVANCNDEIFARYVKWKGDMALSDDKQKAKDEFKSRTWEKRKKEIARKTKKRYLDYTNSQMPFNEGTKASKMAQVGKITGKTEQSRNDNLESLGGLEDDLSEEYSRVRRFDQDRAKKKVRITTTLEAKEAAMSRVLDPNLNLDGILEPHVRKRRAKQGVPRKRSLKKTIYFVSND